MHILVTGGVGYVGSHLVRALLDEGHSVAIVDDLSSGHRQTLADGVALEVGRCGDAAALDRIAATRTPDAVMHLAAKCSVEESVADPGLYYQYNLQDSPRLARLDGHQRSQAHRAFVDLCGCTAVPTSNPSARPCARDR